MSACFVSPPPLTSSLRHHYHHHHHLAIKRLLSFLPQLSLSFFFFWTFRPWRYSVRRGRVMIPSGISSVFTRDCITQRNRFKPIILKFEQLRHYAAATAALADWWLAAESLRKNLSDCLFVQTKLHVVALRLNWGLVCTELCLYYPPPPSYVFRVRTVATLPLPLPTSYDLSC